MIKEFGKICGYATVFNVKDCYNDIILPQSLCKKMITDKIFYQHSYNKEIGKLINIREDDIGLYVEGLIDIYSNYKLYSLVKNQLLNGLSIGYVAKKYRFENNVRILEKIDLIEISLVDFPANKFCRINYCC